PGSRAAPGVVWQFGHHDIREQLANQVSLKGIVVEENHGVETDVQGLANVPDVVGFVVPVGDEGREILAPQDHLGVLFKREQSVVQIVLAAYGQQDSTLE